LGFFNQFRTVLVTMPASRQKSRITLLPFDEGATGKAGTVPARVDDADYRRQVAIAEAVGISLGCCSARKAATKPLALPWPDRSFVRANPRPEGVSSPGFSGLTST
jgi:hypothetical protein